MRLLPHWIDAYLEYTAAQESPEAFHRATAYATIAAVLERRVWVDQQFYIVFPNLYTVLVSGSAVCRKTIAANQGVNLVKKMESPPVLISDDLTTAHLFDELEAAPMMKFGTAVRRWHCGTVYASELAVFIGSDCVQTGLLAMLIKLYDCEDWKHGRRMYGKRVLPRTCLNVLGCTTPSWMRHILPVEVVGGGFMSRVILVNQATTDRPANALPQPSEERKRLEHALVYDLAEIQRLFGEMRFTPDGKQVYTG